MWYNNLAYTKNNSNAVTAMIEHTRINSVGINPDLNGMAIMKTKVTLLS